MLKLLTFEWQRRWKAAAVAFLGYAVLSLLLALWIQAKNLIAVSGGAILILHFMLAAAFMLLVVIDGINAFRLELKQNSRDLYFAFPQSGYQKVGAKLLSSVGFTVVGGAAAILTTLAAVQYHSTNNVLGEVWNLMVSNLGDVSFAATAAFMQLVFFYGLIYLAFAIYRAFFSQFKLGGLITILIYGGLVFLEYNFFSWIESVMPNITTNSSSLWLQQWPTLILLSTVVAVTYGLGGFLMQNRLNLD